MINKLLHMVERVEEKFKPGQPLEKLYPLFEMHETILFTSSTRTPVHAGPHSRDALDSKRLMFTVVIALQPCLLCVDGLLLLVCCYGGPMVHAVLS